MRKIILIGRHGKAKQKPEGGSFDKLEPEGVQQLYNGPGKDLSYLVNEEDVWSDEVFVTHTEKDRTKYTGKAILVGAFGLRTIDGKRKAPMCQEDLDEYGFNGIDFYDDPGLFFGDTKINHKYALDGNYTKILDHWLRNPSAKEHDGVEITPYVDQIAERKKGLKNAIKNVTSGKDKLGVVASHSGLIELPLVELIRTELPVEDLSEIGGSLGMGEFAKLSLEERAGGYKANLRFKDVSYPVNLDKI